MKKLFNTNPTARDKGLFAKTAFAKTAFAKTAVAKTATLLILAFLFTASSEDLSAQTIAYTNATIETVGAAGKIERGTMVVKDGKISEIGTRIRIPDDAKVVSLAGKTIMPGIVDPYYVFGRGNSSTTRTVLIGGRRRTFRVPTSFSVGAFKKVGEYFYPYDTDFKPALRTGITSANLVSDGRGVSAFANIDPDAGEKMLFANSGLLFARVTNQTSALNTLRTGLAKKDSTTAGSKSTSTATSKSTSSSSKTNTTKTSTTKSTAPNSTTKKPDEVSEMWQAVRDGKKPLVVNVNNAATVAHVLKLLKDHEKVRVHLISLGPNLYELLDEIKANKNVSVVLQASIDTVPYSSNRMNVSKMLADKGIPFAISLTLNRTQFQANQDDPLFPIALLVKTGLKRAKALSAITIDPAKMLGIEKTHGSLEKGKFADFLVFDGDPLQNGSRLQKVIQKGRTIHEN